jgi:hypothetical protein
MTNETATVSIRALSQIDKLELLEHVDSTLVRFHHAPLASGELGEPVTALATIAISLASITGLCAWLANKGGDAAVEADIKAAGISASFKLRLTGKSTPDSVRKQLEEKGIDVTANST